MKEKARLGGAAVALLAGAVLIAVSAHRHYPIGRWLFWQYALIWVLTLVWGWSCWAGGFWALTRLRMRIFPARERLLYSFAAGILMFALGLVAVGLAHGLGVVFFVAWPLVLAAPGTRPLARYLKRFGGRLLWARRRNPRVPSLVAAGATLMGILGVALVAFMIMLPENIAYDARWYHVPMAEQYAAAGRIMRFDEGWFNGAFPHLASWLYTWAFLAPVRELTFRVLLCAHIEFLIFLATLASLPLLVDHILPRPRTRAAWAAVFLFPGLLLYDSSLSVAADHVLAFWAIPLWLALRRCDWRLEARPVALFAAMAAGAALTKYQSAALLTFPFALLAWHTLMALRPGAPRVRERLARLRGLAIGAAVCLAITSPHWLLNLIWFHNPVYPLAIDVIGGRPWTEGAPMSFIDPGWSPSGDTLLARSIDTARGVLMFAFEDNDWPDSHGERPVFGYLFALVLPVLPFVRPNRRTLLMAAAALTGVTVWYATYHQARYLQSLLPWMAAATWAILALAWRQSRWLRVPVVLLVAAQLIEGSDVPFIPTHSMIDDSPLKRMIDRVSTGYRGDWGGRFRLENDLVAVGRALPADAKPLLHEEHVRLGLAHPAVSDTRGHQGSIYYMQLVTPTAIVSKLRSLGVTHVVWKSEPRELMRAAEDMVFHDFVQRYLPGARKFGSLHMAALPDAVLDPPDVLRAGLVAVIGCDVDVVPLAKLEPLRRRLEGAKCDPQGRVPEGTDTALSRAKYLLVDKRIAGRVVAGDAAFRRLFEKGEFEAWSH